MLLLPLRRCRFRVCGGWRHAVIVYTQDDWVIVHDEQAGQHRKLLVSEIESFPLDALRDADGNIVLPAA